MKSSYKNILPALIVLAASALPFGAALADSGQAMTEGTIRKVDAEQGKVTIKHGPISNLEMPPMTMVFVLKNPSQLEGMKKGDKVNFHVIDEGGKMVIETIETAG